MFYTSSDRSVVNKVKLETSDLFLVPVAAISADIIDTVKLSALRLNMTSLDYFHAWRSWKLEVAPDPSQS